MRNGKPRQNDTASARRDRTSGDGGATAKPMAGENNRVAKRDGAAYDLTGKLHGLTKNSLCKAGVVCRSQGPPTRRIAGDMWHALDMRPSVDDQHMLSMPLQLQKPTFINLYQ
ncbi:hypothetical protein RvY_05666 [Ramazzottius varieornatus]|uniref:Uncharacterized protein n=1 Tax=Ramazzottius varieornatus TaxID=947166 RepID=A0A1D1UYV0_RAMVA|nr:hypothetical protein RvY_05666 [Ramazzottius varieornatus]